MWLRSVPAPAQRSRWAGWLLLGALSLGVRLALFYAFTSQGEHAWLCYDSAQYHERAQCLIEQGSLTPPRSTQHAYRLPGYPLLLAGLYKLTGKRGADALWPQVVVASAVPFLTGAVAWLLMPDVPWVAAAAALVASVHVGMILFSGMLAPEAISMILLLLLLLALTWYGRVHRVYWLVAAGGLLGCLSLIRPVGHYLLIICVLWLWWEGVHKRSIAAFAASWFVVVAPWLVRNLMLVGGMCFHTLPGMHFVQYTGAAIVMQRDGCEYGKARAHLLDRWEQDTPFKATEYERCRRGERLALSLVLAHPWYATKHVATELFKTLCALHANQLVVADVGGWPTYTRTTTWLEKVRYNLSPPLKTPWLRWLIYWDVALTVGLLLFALLGMLLLLFEGMLRGPLLLCLGVAGTLWGLTLAYGCARLRLPFEPLIIIVAVYAVYRLRPWTVISQLCKRYARPLVGIFLAALLVRLLFFFFFLIDNPCQLLFDSGHYHAMALHLLKQGAFCDVQGVHDFYRLPGYPFFLAACYWLFGPSPVAALLVQLVLAACIPVQVWYLVQSIIKARTWPAWWAAGIAVLHAGLVIFSGLVMTETLFTLLFLGALQAVVALWHAPGWRAAMLAGLLLGACNLVRPLVFVPWVVALLLAALLNAAWRHRVMHATLFLAGWALPVGCWLLRNWLLTGFWFLHTLSGPHLLNHGAARVYAMAHQVPHEQAQRAVQAVVPRLAAATPQEELVKQAMVTEATASAILQEYPLQTLKLALLNVAKTVGALYSAELLCIDSGGQLPSYDGSCNLWRRAQRFLFPTTNSAAVRMICWLEIIYQVLFLIGVVGFVLTRPWWSERLRLHVLLLGICMAMLATTAICGFARLRLPIEPILIMVALEFYMPRRVREGE